MAERTHSRFRALAAVLAGCLLALPAAAQPGTLSVDPCKVAGFTQAEQDEIRSFATARLEQIESGDATARERARKELLAPLRRPCVSVAFRQQYRSAMIDGLRELAGADDETVAITAIYLLGELADDAARQTLQEHTGDDRAAVRYAAIAAMGRTFRAVSATAPAIDPARVAQMVEHLGGRLESEADPLILDVIVRALLDAAQITRDDYAAASTRAVTTLAGGIGPRLRDADPESKPKLYVTTLRVGEAFGARLAGAGAVPAEVARAAAGWAAEVLAHLAHLANTDQLGDAHALAVDIANISERIIVFAHQKLGGSRSPVDLARLLESANGKDFYARVRELVLSLEQPPVRVDAETMRRIRDALAGG